MKNAKGRQIISLPNRTESARVSGVAALMVISVMTICLAGCSKHDSFLNGNDNQTTGSFAIGSSDRSTNTHEAVVLKTGDVVTNSIGLKLAVIPPGQFDMGSPPTEEKRSGDERQHQVRITQPILMGVYEVTQAEFQQVMGMLPEAGEENEKLPATNVTWEQAVAFCQKLSARPDEKASGRVYRLPTEAEWEYACRAGTTSATYFGNSLTSMQANFDGNYPYASDSKGAFLGKPQMVGAYQPNALGLYDMHGNVWEWCHDWYAADAYRDSSAEDPQGPMTGTSHVIRGGSWYNFGYACRSAYRSEFTPPLDANIYGFRVVASLGISTFEPGEMPAISVADSEEKTMILPEEMMPELPSETKSKPIDDADSQVVKESSKAKVSQNERSEGADVVTVKPETSAWPIFFIVANLLVCLGLVDTAKLKSMQNLDLFLLVLVISSAMMHLITPHVLVASSTLICTCVLIARLLTGFRKTTLPIAVGLDIDKTWLVSLLLGAAGVRFIATVGIGGSDASLKIVAFFLHVLIGSAIVAIGRRRRFKLAYTLGIAIVWMLMPYGPSVTEINPWICVTATLWAFLAINRPFVSGTLLGLGAVAGVQAILLVPLWSFFYLGRPRFQFGMSVAIAGLAGLIATETAALTGLITVDANWTFPLFIERWIPPGANSFIFVLSVVLAVACLFPLVRKTESALLVLSTVILLVGQFITAPLTLPNIAVPWILLALMGMAATRNRVIWTRGIYPQFLRLLQRGSRDLVAHARSFWVKQESGS